MLIERKWAMPNKWTFKIEPIHSLLRQEFHDNHNIIDPFCGRWSVAEVKNDLNLELDADYHMDALEFLKMQKSESFEGAFYDPPYSMRQAVECYKSFGKEKQGATVTSMQFWSKVKDELARILKPKGKVLSCGWSSQGLGENRGFEMKRILLVAHGGSRNDTICTIETKNLKDKTFFD